MFKELNWINIPGSFEHDVANYNPEYNDSPEMCECHHCMGKFVIEDLVKVNFDDDHVFLCENCNED